MTAAKELELVLRARDLASAVINRPAQAMRDATRAAADLNNNHTRLLQTEFELEQRLNRLTTATSRYLRIQEDENATTRQRQQAGRALERIYNEQAAATRRLTDAQRQLTALPAVAGPTTHLALDQARLAVLRAQANTGNQHAATELRVVATLDRQRQERLALERLARSDLLAARQRVRVQQQLNQLARAHTAELAAARRNQLGMGLGGGRLGFGRAALSGFTGGLTAAGANPLLGLGAGAAVAGGPATLGLTAAAATAYGGVRAVQEAADYESALNRVLAITQANREETLRLDQANRQLGRTTIFTAQQSAEAQQNLAIAGFKVNQILAAQKPVLDLAAAGQLDLAESAKIVARIMAGMDIQAQDVGDTVDKLVYAFTHANTDLSELGTAFSFVGPIAHTTGQSIDGTTAAIMALSDAGLAGEKAGTSSRQILVKLADATGDAQKRLQELNITTTDTRGNMLPLVDIIEQFEDRLNGIGSGERLQILSKIFEARAAAGFAILVDRGADSLRRMEADLDKAGGTADRVAEQSLEGMRGETIRLQSAISGLGIELGTLATGPGSDAVVLLTDLTNGATDFFAALREGRGQGSAVGEFAGFLGDLNNLGQNVDPDTTLFDALTLGLFSSIETMASLREAQREREKQEEGLNQALQEKSDERIRMWEQERDRYRQVFNETGQIISAQEARQQLTDIAALNQRMAMNNLPTEVNDRIGQLHPKDDTDEIQKRAQLIEDLRTLEARRLHDVDEALRLAEGEALAQVRLLEIRRQIAEQEALITKERREQAEEAAGIARDALRQAHHFQLGLQNPSDTQRLATERLSLGEAFDRHIAGLEKALKEDGLSPALRAVIQNDLDNLRAAREPADAALRDDYVQNTLDAAYDFLVKQAAGRVDPDDEDQSPRIRAAQLEINQVFDRLEDRITGLLDVEGLTADQKGYAQRLADDLNDARQKALDDAADDFKPKRPDIGFEAIRADQVSRFNFSGGNVNTEAQDRRALLEEAKAQRKATEAQNQLLREYLQQKPEGVAGIKILS